MYGSAWGGMREVVWLWRANGTNWWSEYTRLCAKQMIFSQKVEEIKKSIEESEKKIEDYEAMREKAVKAHSTVKEENEG